MTTTQIAELQGSTILLHGPPKVGKTTFAASFPGPVWWIATEAGHRFLPPDQKLLVCGDWEAVKTAGSSAIKSDEPKTVVLDTVGNAYPMCMEWVCSQFRPRISHPGDADHGKGWSAVEREFAVTINRLSQQLQAKNVTLVMIAHTKLEEVKTRSESWNRFSINLPGQAHKVVTPVPDYIMHYTFGKERDLKGSNLRQTGARTLYVGGNESIEAGARDPNIRVTALEDVPAVGQYQFICENLYQES